MACFSPLSAWQSVFLDDRGKSIILFRCPTGGTPGAFKLISLPCGRCIGCRLERSRQWAVRCMHEASLWPHNCFITLTYDGPNLPADGSLNVRDFQLFMKRLRKRFGNGIRFLHCGEYGELRGRPHYHALLFNFDFPDKVFWKSDRGNRLYRSAALEELWDKGFSSVASLTFKSAAYVCRYNLKKVVGKNADEHYFDPLTGVYRRPEYITMSRRPGIAAGWFQKYSSDVFPRDYVVVNGREAKPPRYYDKLLEGFNPEMWFSISAMRGFRAAAVDLSNAPSLDSQRLNVEARVNMFKRSID